MAALNAKESGMVFSATSSCTQCNVRFARRSGGCPSCGASVAPAGAARAPLRHMWIAVVGALVVIGCAAAGYTMMALCVGVATLLAFVGTNTGTPNAATDPKTRTRVFTRAETAAAEATTLTGIARRATVEIEGPLSGKPCLVFGLHGEVGDHDVEDADGGDFDLELPSGERVMISLEHAMLVKEAKKGRKTSIEPGGPLASFLADRGVAHGSDAVATLEEHLVRDGDHVTVTGTELGGTVTSLEPKTTPKTRVLGGDEDHPLVVHVD